MGYLTRKPTSNEPSSDTSNPWGSESDVYDDTAVLLNQDGKRCCNCKRVILNRYITYKGDKPYCPDCK